MTSETTLMTAAENTSDAAAPESSQSAADVTPAADTQPATTPQPEAGAKPAEDQAKPQGAPEQYTFKPVEGAAFDDAVLGAFSEVAKQLNLTQDAAQQVLDKMGPAMASRQAEQIESARNEWANTAKADKEYGGEKFTENLAVAKKALDAFGSPELTALLDQSGFGNHPDVIRFFYRAGKAISEDGFVSGQSGKASHGDARRLYAASNMNP